MAKKENCESWSVDKWLEDLVSVMVPVPESETVAAPPRAPADAHVGRNGKPKAARPKPRKKKPTRRRKD
jgi:hypothetical protein